MPRINRPHWSFSSINQYLRCPLQFYFERVLKIPRATISSSLVFGSAVHDALATYHLGLQRGQSIPLVEIQKTFRSSWSVRESEQIVDFKPSESKDDLTAKAMTLLDLYSQEPPPEKIVSVEYMCLVPLQTSQGKFLETPLAATTDLVTVEDESIKVNEFKTSARAYSSFEVDSSIQATCYANSMRYQYDRDAAVRFVVLIKTKTPKIQQIEVARSEDDLRRLGDLVESIERAVQNKIFYPIESPLNCSGCSYRKECREWKPSRMEAEKDLYEIESATC